MSSASRTKSAMASSAMFDELPYYRDYKLEPDEIDLRSYLLDTEHQADAIPTPTVLAKLQRTQGQPPRNPSAKDAPPFPPRRLKKEIFDPDKYTKKDAYVRSLLPEQLESEDEFARRLFKESSSNLDKVRAAFYFVSTAAVDSMQQGEQGSSIYRAVRDMRSDKTNDVTDIFCQLVGLGGVPCTKICGFKKNLHQAGRKLQLNGTYTACYVEGEWRFVDPHWGSSGISGSDQGDYAKIDEATGEVESAQKTAGSLVYVCDEFYFLTDPVELVQNHLPQEDMQQWQLLVRPLTMDEFLRAPNYFAGSKQYLGQFSIELQSHPLNVIIAPPGTIEILLKETRRQEDETYVYRPMLKISKRDVNDSTRTAIKDQVEQEGRVSKQIIMPDGVVKFVFKPPCASRFMLDIHVSKASLSSWAPYLSYVIHCPKANERAEKPPRGDKGLAAFGPGPELARAGLQTSAAGEFTAEDGEQTLALTVQDGKDHSLDYLLMGADDHEWPSNFVLSWTDGNQINVMILSPGSGLYAVVVRERKRPLCQFLMDAPSQFADCEEFGMPDFNRLGGLGVTDRGLRDVIEMESHETPVIQCQDPEVRLQFRMTVRMEVRAELIYINSNSTEEKAEGFAFVSSSSESFEVSVRLQLPGHYVTRLQARQPSSVEWRHFGNYFVRSQGDLDGSACQFPRPGEAWSSGNRLVEPTNRLLPLNEFVPIVLQISDPDVQVAYVENVATKKRVALNRNERGLWEGRVRGDSQLAGTEARVMGGPNVNECGNLLSFFYRSQEDEKRRNQVKQRAAEIKQRRTRSRKLRLRQQENYHLGERALELLPEDPDKDGAEHLAMEAKRKAGEAKRQQQQQQQQMRRFTTARQRQEAQLRIEVLQQLSLAEHRHEEYRQARRLRRQAQEERRAAESAKRERLRERRRSANKLALQLHRDPEAKTAEVAEIVRRITEDSAGEELNSDEEGLLVLTDRTRNAGELKAELEVEAKAAKISCDPCALKSLVSQIDSRGFSQVIRDKLEPDLGSARRLVSQLERRSQTSAWRQRDEAAALSSLASPSPTERRVVAAALLLLGHCEAETKSWKRCQAAVSRARKQLASRSAHRVHPDIAARAAQLLGPVDRDDLHTFVAGLYDWAVAVASAALDGTNEPAKSRRQRQLLGVSEDAMKGWKQKNKNSDISD